MVKSTAANDASVNARTQRNQRSRLRCHDVTWKSILLVTLKVHRVAHSLSSSHEAFVFTSPVLNPHLRVRHLCFRHSYFPIHKLRVLAHRRRQNRFVVSIISMEDDDIRPILRCSVPTEILSQPNPGAMSLLLVKSPGE